MSGRKEFRAVKAQTLSKLYELLGVHKQIIVVSFMNVGSSQVHQIRRTLRQYDSTLYFSKNTLIKKAIRMRTEGIDAEEFKPLVAQFGGKIPQLAALLPKLKSKVALIFSDAPVSELKEKIESNKMPSQARIGTISPVDFVCPTGPTGLDPSQINFFHALNISTKIVKGQIEITKEYRVCTVGKKVKASEAALLKKLNLKPFAYGMKISDVYDDGVLVPEHIFTMTAADILAKFQKGVNNVAALSLGAGYPIEATIPLIISQSFRNIAALSLESGFKVKEVEGATKVVKEVKEAVKEEAPKKDAKKKEEKKQPAKVEAPPPVQEDQGMGGLFD